LGRQDLFLTVEILGLGIWSLRDYKSRSKESERHTLSKEKFWRAEREERKERSQQEKGGQKFQEKEGARIPRKNECTDIKEEGCTTKEGTTVLF
jgi:hypothetical protein